jgi:hypothetical protein
MAKQYGAAHRTQLFSVGQTRHSIQRRLDNGLLVPAHPGVYFDAASPTSRERDIMAATLWAGPTAAASSVTAAGLLGMAASPLLIDIAVDRFLRRRPGIRLHRVMDMTTGDMTYVGPIPVTSPVRTLIDLAAVLTEAALEVVLETGLRDRLLTIDELRNRLGALGTPGRKGAGVLVDLLELRHKGETPTASALETLVARAVREGELPAPVRQHPVHDEEGLIGYLDFAYPWALLNLEADSFRWHTGRRDWRRELRKRNRLMRLHWRIRHITEEEITSGRAALVGDIRRLLDEGMQHHAGTGGSMLRASAAAGPFRRTSPTRTGAGACTS